MNPTPRPRHRLSSPLLLLVLATFANAALGQITEVGGIARSFQITNRSTRQPIRLADFAGKVLVLDFFAYWCGPCRVSSPDLETNVKDWFASRGGNTNGVPVAVVPVNVESANESATDSFIRGAGLDLVANDYSASAYNQFETGYIPLFVIINGVPDSPSHRQWEVLYRDSGYPGAEAVRSVINRVKASDPLSRPRIVVDPEPRVVGLGESFRLNVAATGAGPFTYQWHHNGLPIPSATSDSWSQTSATFEHSGRYSVRVANVNGLEYSSPVDVRVIQTGPATRYVSSDVPRSIPDPPSAGITSTLTVPAVGMIGRLRLSLRIDHPYAGDLRATLSAPDGTTTMVYNRESGVAEGVRLTDLIVPEATGHSARGVWTLSVWDMEADDVGTLVSWSLSLELQTDPAPVSFETWIATFPGLKPEDR